MATLSERLDSGEVIILDGPMGTELQRRGVPMNGTAWSATAMLTHPNVIQEIHEDYVRAGADVITINTFSCSRFVLAEAGFGTMTEDFLETAIEMAQEAREAAAGDRDVFIAGSLSTFFPKGDRRNAPHPAQARAHYQEQAQQMVGLGVELLVLEMMQDVEYAGYAIEAAAETGLPVWVGFSCKVQDGTVMLLEGAPGSSFAGDLPSLMAHGGDALGVMHTEVADTAPALQVVLDNWSGALAAYPNSGDLWRPNGQLEKIISPTDFLTHAQQWVQMGVQIVGACCGMGPEHIAALRGNLPTHIEGRRGG